VGESGVPVLVSRTPDVFGDLWSLFFAGVIKSNQGARVVKPDCNDSPIGWLFRISQKLIKRRCDYSTREEIIDRNKKIGE